MRFIKKTCSSRSSKPIAVSLQPDPSVPGVETLSISIINTGSSLVLKAYDNTGSLSKAKYSVYSILELIPYYKFNDIKYITKGGFVKVYSATWIDGRIIKWEKGSNSWERSVTFAVTLKIKFFENHHVITAIV
ncbi:hypothetical protein C1645_813026 [Glomus cerebriforme]|uniref:Uncharacterized protein n=1 Tax=Glomus cerebriforme TaxID=658196 RepID=A0A397TTR3_9GLOM|nr:hypothetical protein C1645_813026 [Glomus cerebriforme]